jgi:hypothetical protein
MLREASYYSRMTLGVYKLARMPLEPDPKSLVQRTLENRNANFLDLVRRVIFGNPSNPYYTLFQWAGCTYGDLDHAIRKDGLEPTLESLRKSGVYLANDEFKGKRPIERSGRQIQVESEDFANPFVKGLIHATSGGSRSRGTTTWRSLEFQIYREAQTCVFFDQYQLSKRPIVGIRGILPSDGGMRLAVNSARRGLYYDKWFALGGSFRGYGHYRLVTRFLLLEARMLGVPVNFPTYLPHNDFSPVARWIAQRRSEGAQCILWAGVSQGVRVAAAAAEEGLDISGTTCLLGAEALTDAKREVVEASGCEALARYGITELGQVGVACPQMNKGNTVHVCMDSLAVIGYRRTAPLTEVEIDSLMFTTLLPSAAFVLVNVEMDDSGVLEPARCGCSLHAMGFTQQVSNIYSYGRLTGQGMTLVGGDMLRILEHSLPRRFGGTNTDYQLVECEGANQTEIELRVHPRVGAKSTDEVRSFFLSEMQRLWGGGLTRRVWEQTEGVRVVIAEPYLSGKQRVHPLHLLGTTQQQRRGMPGRTEAAANGHREDRR